MGEWGGVRSESMRGDGHREAAAGKTGLKDGAAERKVTATDGCPGRQSIPFQSRPHYRKVKSQLLTDHNNAEGCLRFAVHTWVSGFSCPCRERLLKRSANSTIPTHFAHRSATPAQAPSPASSLPSPCLLRELCAS